MKSIFICYRREDSQFVTDRIFDHLIKIFHRKFLFKDVDSIPPAVDFHSHIKKAIERSAVVLAIIGPGWVSAKNDAGQRRLEDPEDFVYIELSTALHLQCPVLPVLVGGARMPTAAELPSALQPLARIHAVSVRSDPDFKGDFARLQRALEGIPEIPHGSRRTLAFIAAVLGVIVVVSAIVWYLTIFTRPSPIPFGSEVNQPIRRPPISQTEPTTPPSSSSDGCVDVPFADMSKFPPVRTSKHIC